ncbi:hypothetical protein CEXT_773681 [Caerostris extrusa]|uniref:Uncharacterized protein n=1 Tax=Caerostris extrusa TaxID=172846 RepID=A0AAV4UQB5_CAEEX|nr:hypothetical protein CEXT_773681 [Caerostris extrusa]
MIHVLDDNLAKWGMHSANLWLFTSKTPSVCQTSWQKLASLPAGLSVSGAGGKDPSSASCKRTSEIGSRSSGGGGVMPALCVATLHQNSIDNTNTCTDSGGNCTFGTLSRTGITQRSNRAKSFPLPLTWQHSRSASS